MLQFKQYVKVKSLEEAYELNQKKNNTIIGGMHWLKMSTRAAGTAIDLSGLGLDEIVETEDAFEIGCMVSLRALEVHKGLNEYTNGAVRDAVKDIVGVQFRNTATVGGSIFGRYGFSDVLTVFLALDTTVVCHQAGEIPLEKYAKKKPDRDIIVKLIVKKVPGKIAYLSMRRTRTDFPVLAVAVSNMGGVWKASVGARPQRAEVVVDEKEILSNLAAECEAESFTSKATEFGRYVSEQLSYSSNLRGSAEYRKQITPVLIRRAIVSMKGEQ